MSITYNQNKKSIFNGYIDTAVSNLKKAKNATSRVSECDFPTKTIIGRKFNKKGKIYTLKNTIINDYLELLSIKGEVEKQVLDYLDANRKSSMAIKTFRFYNIGLTKLYEEQVKKKYKDTNENWIEINIGGKKVGYYVDHKGNIVRNATINGVEFDENGLAKDYTQYHMMRIALTSDIPKGIEIESEYIEYK